MFTFGLVLILEADFGKNRKKKKLQISVGKRFIRSTNMVISGVEFLFSTCKANFGAGRSIFTAIVIMQILSFLISVPTTLL